MELPMMLIELPMMLIEFPIIEFPMMLRVDYWFTYGAESELYAYAASDLLPICENVKNDLCSYAPRELVPICVFYTVYGYIYKDDF